MTTTTLSETERRMLAIILRARARGNRTVYLSAQCAKALAAYIEPPPEPIEQVAHG